MLKLKTPFSLLGDSWGEIIGNSILLIFVGPLYLFLYAITWLWGVIGLVLNFPVPKQIPEIINDDKLSPDEILQIYVKNFKEIFPGLTIRKDVSNSAVDLMNDKANISLWTHDDTVGITVEGVDTGFWHNGEEESIDIFFWYAVAALRSGIQYKKSMFGRKEGWVYSDEMEIWMGVSTGEDVRMSSYVKYSRKF